jgi:hypothetical protein
MTRHAIAESLVVGYACRENARMKAHSSIAELYIPGGIVVLSAPAPFPTNNAVVIEAVRMYSRL